jgi:hypothetical protein
MTSSLSNQLVPWSLNEQYESVITMAKKQDIFVIKPAGYIEIAQKQQKCNNSSTQKTKMR